MSVDDQLRQALQRTAADFDPQAPGGMEAVITTARRRRAGRRIAAVAAVVLAVGVGAAAAVHQQSGSAAPPLVPAASPSTASSTPTPGRAAADTQLAADLRGTWTTGVLTPEAATAAMVRTGNAGHRDAVMKEWHLPGTVTVTFEELAYTAHLDGKSVDEGTWHVVDGELLLYPYCTISCRVRLGPHLSGGVLNLDLLEDDTPDQDRVPGAAYSSVLYSSTPFHRP